MPGTAYVIKVTKTAWGPEVRALVGRWKTLESTGMYLTFPEQSPVRGGGHPREWPVQWGMRVW